MRELLFSDKSVLPDIATGPTLQRSQLAVRRAREEFRSFGRQYSFDDDDIIPCRQRPSLLSPFPWHRPINEHYPQRGNLWTRQSSSLEHLWPHPSWERQATIDLGGDDLLTPASILGRLPRQDRAFEEGKNMFPRPARNPLLVTNLLL
ncbi:uncharacterized protein [Apostichopus japonicus]|uniref:uncharacterized protein n=1 Tax=Stichopus japonicus TaxID=307972 RepID=UPI003AB7CBB5